MTNPSKYLAKAYQRAFLSLHLPPKTIISPAQRIPSTQRTNLFSSRTPSSIRTMASDSDYMAFLDKANKQRDAGRDEAHTEESTQPSKQVRTETVESGVKVPDSLKKVDAFYVSETDEPFEPVVLSWKGASSGRWPSNGASFLFTSWLHVVKANTTFSRRRIRISYYLRIKFRCFQLHRNPLREIVRPSKSIQWRDQGSTRGSRCIRLQS